MQCQHHCDHRKTTMTLNRDEFLLLSRTGRGPYSTRAGPWPDERFDADLKGRWFRRRGRTGLSLRRGKGRALDHVLGPRSGRPVQAPRVRTRINDETYFAMEFVVGFPADEETLF